MAEYIDRDLALSFPFANGKYDHEHANQHFIYGCETYKEWLEGLPIADVAEVRHGRWIPVTERLPEEDTAVLTWGSQGVILLDWRRGNKWCCFGGVTHWMPLPQPPTDCSQMVTDSNQVQEDEK